MKQMNLLIVISSMDGGGAARIVGNITCRLPENWNIDILLNNSEEIVFPYRGNIVSLNIKLADNRLNFFYLLNVFIKRIKKIQELKKQQRYDCCISYLDSANVVNVLCRDNRCKTVLNIVNNMSASARFSKLYRYIVNPMIKLFYNKADYIIALSEDVKNDMISSYAIKPDILGVSYCSINISEIDKTINDNKDRITNLWFDREKTVITAGRMEKQKGQWHLIRAFSRVVKAVPDAKLAVFGEGSLKEYYLALIDGYKLQNNVKLFDFSSELTAYIAKSAIFAFPSLYEGFGTALQEALACNVPCIATDYDSGAKEQLDPHHDGSIKGIHYGEYGILTEQCSDKMPGATELLEDGEIYLADSIIELLNDQTLREKYAKKARERSYVFDIDTIAKRWIEDIERVVLR